MAGFIINADAYHQIRLNASGFITISGTIFFRLLAYAPEELQREVKEDEAIAEAIERYIHDAIIEKEQRREENDLT